MLPSGRRKKSLLFMIENQSLWLTVPMVSSNVIALMLRDARMASLSAIVGSSWEGTWTNELFAKKEFVFNCKFFELKKHRQNLKLCDLVTDLG